MKYTLFLIGSIGFVGLTATFFPADVPVEAGTVSKPGDLVVHEWGTFTSIAGKNGVAIDWRPLDGASDLPTFVHTPAKQTGFRATFHDPGKGELARVRMETPVIYFYTKQKMDVSVKVDFPKGRITEWYPQAGVVNAQFAPDRKGRFETGINWGIISLLPDDKPVFLREAADSHYYPARETDAVPLQVCNADKTKIEKEKFLFYRGIGNFELPLQVRMDGEKLVLVAPGITNAETGGPTRNITNAIVFENRRGRIGYTLVPDVSGDTPVERPQLNRSINDVYAELEKTLISQGLYQKEARAMIETWKDSWFEEGLRVFCILPRVMTDEVLPLKIEPRPTETVRVLVGRVEVITPETQSEVRRQIGLLRSGSPAERQGAVEALKRHGRFYLPVLKSMLETETNAAVRRQLQALIAAAN